MIAVVPPLWAILLLALVVGAAALLVVVLGLLWIWGRRKEPPAPESELPFAALQDSINRAHERRRRAAEQLSMVGVRIVNNTVTWTAHGITTPQRPRPRPFDWAHRIKHLAPDHYITGRGLALGTTKWPPRG